MRVQDFLKNVPVRKQTALKTSAKILTNVRKLLYAYSFARPEVRLSFKVLKSKDDKLNWNCAPSTSETTLSEHAVKIVGKSVASQLTSRTLGHGEIDGSEHSEDGQYRIEALVISPNLGAKPLCRCRFEC